MDLILPETVLRTVVVSGARKAAVFRRPSKIHRIIGRSLTSVTGTGRLATGISPDAAYDSQLRK